MSYASLIEVDANRKGGKTSEPTFLAHTDSATAKSNYRVISGGGGQSQGELSIGRLGLPNRACPVSTHFRLARPRGPRPGLATRSPSLPRPSSSASTSCPAAHVHSRSMNAAAFCCGPSGSAPSVPRRGGRGPAGAARGPGRKAKGGRVRGGGPPDLSCLLPPPSPPPPYGAHRHCPPSSHSDHESPPGCTGSLEAGGGGWKAFAENGVPSPGSRPSAESVKLLHIIHIF